MVQCPNSKATVLTLCSVCTVQDELIPAASPYSCDPVKQILQTMVVKAKMGERYLPFLYFSGGEAFVLKRKKNQIKSQVDSGVMRYGKRLCLVGKMGSKECVPSKLELISSVRKSSGEKKKGGIRPSTSSVIKTREANLSSASSCCRHTEMVFA